MLDSMFLFLNKHGFLEEGLDFLMNFFKNALCSLHSSLKRILAILKRLDAEIKISIDFILQIGFEIFIYSAIFDITTWAFFMLSLILIYSILT